MKAEQYPMIGFEVPFARQLANVLEGRTADGTHPSALYRLPKMDAFTDLRRILAETTAWTLYGLTDELRAREELRTFVIWSTAAHLWRLTREGYNLTRAGQEAEWMSRAIAAHPAFLATTLFARKAMPELAAFNLVKDRAALRARTLNTYLAIQAVSRVNCHMPERTAFTYRYTVYRHRTPQDFQDYSAVADRWRAHIDAIFTDTETDHGYWAQVARGERMLFTFATGGVRKASFDLHLGNVTALDLHEPVSETTYDLLATALVHLGNVLKLPNNAPNAVIQTLLTNHARNLREQKASLAQIPHDASEENAATTSQTDATEVPSNNAGNSKSGLCSVLKTILTTCCARGPNANLKSAPVRNPAWRTSTDTFLAYVVLSVALSYLVPLALIAAPQLIRNYVHVWRVALSMEPGCPAPTEAWSTDCDPLRSRTSSSPIPIPPHTGGQP